MKVTSNELTNEHREDDEWFLRQSKIRLALDNPTWDFEEYHKLNITHAELLPLIKADGMRLSGVPDLHKNRSLVHAAVSQNGFALRYVPFCLMDNEITSTAIKNRPGAISLALKEHLTPESIETGAEECPLLVSNLPSSMVTEKAWIMVMRVAPDLLCHIPLEAQTKAIVDTYISRKPTPVLGDIRRDLLSDELLLDVARKEHMKLKLIPLDICLRMGELTAAFNPPATNTPISYLFNKALSAYRHSSLLSDYQAVEHLRNLPVSALKPFLKDEEGRELVRRIHGSAVAIKASGSRKQAKQWLSEDLGL